MMMGLMGAGISRSRMPRLQTHLAEQVGISVEYRLIDGELSEVFDPVATVLRLQDDGLRGINVTHPYKQVVYPLVHQPAIEGHECIGSYNTLLFNGALIDAANTDFSGFMRGYRYRLGEQAPGRVVIAGAGGVGRAIAFGLAKLGASHIHIYDLSAKQADSLCQVLVSSGYQASVLSSHTEFLTAAAAADGLVNCTALGMYSHPGNAFDGVSWGRQSWAFDAVYTPLKTRFIADASQAKLSCLSGFDLWIFQGLDAFQLFTGQSVEATDELIATALSWLD